MLENNNYQLSKMFCRNRNGIMFYSINENVKSKIIIEFFLIKIFFNNNINDENQYNFVYQFFIINLIVIEFDKYIENN